MKNVFSCKWKKAENSVYILNVETETEIIYLFEKYSSQNEMYTKK